MNSNDAKADIECRFGLVCVIDGVSLTCYTLPCYKLVLFLCETLCPLCPLCLCGERINHKDTKDTKNKKTTSYWQGAV